MKISYRVNMNTVVTQIIGTGTETEEQKNRRTEQKQSQVNFK
jgi:hypothetical protein